MKKTVDLSGHIVFPLREGVEAYIASSKGMVYTSKVVKIISITNEIAHFETMNSAYKVVLEKSPVAMAQTLPKCA